MNYIDWQAISAITGILAVIVAYLAWRRPITRHALQRRKALLSEGNGGTEHLNPLALVSLLAGMSADSSKVKTCKKQAALIKTISLAELTELINTVVADSSKVEIVRSFNGKIRKDYSPQQAKNFSDQFVGDSSKEQANGYLTN